MIFTKRVTPRRFDIFETLTQQCIGDATCGYDGVFQWFPISRPNMVFGAALLHAVANALDSLNAESTKQSDANTPTATD